MHVAITMKNLMEPIQIEKPVVSIAVRQYIDAKKRYFILKRLFDITVSLLVSVFFLSWLFPLIAILIRLESRGPVLFIQRRVGMGGRTFRCLKFRTMVVNREANSRQAQVNDRRITRIGQFLRISNLDEFPQFFNVLAGDMSIVGPRPHMHSDCTKFSSVVSGYKFRNMVKPGITGLAQVKGYRGPTKDFASIFHRYQFDAFYIRNANFWLDMRIIRKTAGQTLIALIGKFDRVSRPDTFTNRRWVMAIRSFLS
ncbi:MAG: capsular biosynthesis protein [Chitinophagaceae bacterium]|nr:MAG: capsular biosynthesis protein [Chitinophagaceae bacterium]